MNRFMRRNGFDNYGDLYRWSIDDIAGFWEAVCDFFDVRFDKRQPLSFVARTAAAAKSVGTSYGLRSAKSRQPCATQASPAETA
jgi:hypothetical protein